MPIVSKTRRQTDYNLFPPSVPIVIDNGASYFRIGWAGETEPRVVFRNIVQRPRHKATGETVTIVGDQDPAMMKFFDCTRSGPRSAFDSNVVYQFEIMEYILDFAFDRLGASGSAIDHPILITECVGNPVYSRCKMAELLFETYGVPSVAFGVDAAFSYKYNQRHGKCQKDGIVICPGFTTTHTIPAEELKLEHCYIAPDYVSEARKFQVTQALRKARGEPKDEADEFEENTDSNEKYPLINVPDNMLTPEQIKDKKKQLFLKTTTEGRLRARQKRNEEELEKERRNQLEEERRRCPEILFHPNLVGIDQVGLDEMAGASIRRLPHDDKELEERLTSSILMTGGCSLVPGMKERLECGIRMIRPCGSTINVVQAKDPVLDAWRGASAFAADLNFLGNAFTKKDYYEKGEEWLRRYQIRYNTL
ncbi:hypothetical protein F2Q69_00031821 [Brassica cretica]|uniref:Actin-related protein 5 n=1 Tax=Brassica cretica TaxID=69181 RepID=A0A8S9RXG4_BRACR|nr:hypothetical protein F2Q69_00031821 [Brassica cretica]